MFLAFACCMCQNSIRRVQDDSTTIDPIDSTQPTEVFLFDQRVENVLKEHGLPAAKPLQGEIGKKIYYINDLKKELKDATEHSTRDKLIGVCLIALAVAVVAAEIVGCVYNPALIFWFLMPIAQGILFPGLIGVGGMSLLHRQSDAKDCLEQLKKALADELKKKENLEHVREYQEGLQKLLHQLNDKMKGVKEQDQLDKLEHVKLVFDKANPFLLLQLQTHTQNPVVSAPPLVE